MRGNEDLGGSLRADFGLEQGFQADNGTATNPQFRNAYVGLSGVFGAFALGSSIPRPRSARRSILQITQERGFRHP
ncbi:porin [Cupriavidus basilensis]